MLKVDGKASCEGQTTWCIVKPSTGDERLIANIQFCCDHVDCSIIQPGGACYEPNNNYSHASVVMHLFYRANNKLPHTCDFMQSGLIISQDPCKLESFPFATKLLSIRLYFESCNLYISKLRMWRSDIHDFHVSFLQLLENAFMHPDASEEGIF